MCKSLYEYAKPATDLLIQKPSNALITTKSPDQARNTLLLRFWFPWFWWALPCLGVVLYAWIPSSCCFFGFLIAATSCELAQNLTKKNLSHSHLHFPHHTDRRQQVQRSSNMPHLTGRYFYHLRGSFSHTCVLDTHFTAGLRPTLSVNESHFVITQHYGITKPPFVKCEWMELSQWKMKQLSK